MDHGVYQIVFCAGFTNGVITIANVNASDSAVTALVQIRDKQYQSVTQFSSGVVMGADGAVAPSGTC